MASVGQMQRIFEIDRRLRRLRAGQFFGKEEFAREMGVHERAIRRDLNCMRDKMGMPVEKDRATGGYRYTSEPAALPSTLISKDDRLNILLCLKAVEQYRATPLYEPLRSLYGRLLEAFPAEQATDFARVAACVRFEGSPLPPIDKKVWDVILLCIEATETMEMTYRTGRDGSERDRQVDPYGLIVKDRQWYLVGFDHYRQAVRTFAVPRILRAGYTDDERKFRVDEGFLDRYLSTAIDGQQSTGRVYKVKLRLAKDAPPALVERIWTLSEKRSRDREGRTIVEFRTGALYEVERQVLALGGNAEVVEPSALRKQVGERSAGIMNLHI